MTHDFDSLDKGDLYDLANKLLINDRDGDRDGISKCVEFILADTMPLNWPRGDCWVISFTA